MYLTLYPSLRNISQVELCQVFASKIMKANPCLSLRCKTKRGRSVSFVRKKANLSRKPKETLFWSNVIFTKPNQHESVVYGFTNFRVHITISRDNDYCNSYIIVQFLNIQRKHDFVQIATVYVKATKHFENVNNTQALNNEHTLITIALQQQATICFSHALPNLA